MGVVRYKMPSYTASDYIACMFHIDEIHYDYIENTLQEYDIGNYIIGHEKTPYSHFHIMFQGTDKIYSAFSKRLVEKFELRGRSGGGKSKQYGKVKHIENVVKMASYTVKDGNVRSNMDQEELDKYKQLSYQAKEQQKLVKKILAELHKDFNIMSDDDTVKVRIVHEIITQTKEDFYFTKSLVEKIFLLFLRTCDSESSTTRTQIIYNYLYKIT